jgi:hypothetical protein
MSAAFDAWVDRARAVHIEDVIERRGIKLRRQGVELVGPCPKCGGEDRFAINIKKQVFNCRHCEVGGDVIDLVMHLDGREFVGACETLTGEPPPKGNGKDPTAEPKKIVANEFTYPNEDGSTAFVVERIEFQNPDGTFVLTKKGKRKKTFRQKRPDPDRPGQWIWSVDGAPVVPYRLPELIEAIAAGHDLDRGGRGQGRPAVELERPGDVLRHGCCKVEARALGIPARRRRDHPARQ